MQSEVLARLKAIIADAEADMAEHFSDAKETGERADLADAEVCLLVDDAKAIVAALSAAEPVEWQRKTDDFGWQRVNAEDLPHYRAKGAELRALYAAPPAPSVAVKALDWKQNREDWEIWSAPTILGPYDVMKILDKWEVTRNTVGKIDALETLDAAKAAAQADYEARIRSALSAQVQDVAGWERITIETGRKSGTSHADVWPDGEGWEIDTDRGRVNTPDAGWDRFSHHEELYFRRRANALPAAPAKQEGKS